MNSLRYLSLFAVVAPLAALADEWPQFLGPDGQGHANVERLPVRWSESSENIAWKAEIPGSGWSSPVIAGERLWVTTATEEGRSLRLVCLDAETGREVYDVEALRQESPQRVHTKNSHASPTPVVEGDRLYVHFGAAGTACLSIDGKVIWRNQLEYNMVHGPGGSPVLHEGLLYLNCDGGDVQFVVALEAATGEIRWKSDRPENPSKTFAFSTPLVIEGNGEKQLVSAGAGSVVSYDPRTGDEIWRVEYPGGYSTVPKPVFGHGMVYLSTGYDRPSLLAIRADGQGNVTDTHVAWAVSRNAPLNPSPLLVGDELYLVSDRGVAACVDARSGEQHWQERLGGNFSASPVFGAGKIYLLNETGETTVIAPGREYQELAVNQLPGRTLATPALCEGALFLRTDGGVYRINE
jgi:outer membrane protein assembly factor BamB